MPVRTHNRSGVPPTGQLGELSVDELLAQLRRTESRLAAPQSSMPRKLSLKRRHAIEREIERRQGQGE
jgi:hypothetical protein